MSILKKIIQKTPLKKVSKSAGYLIANAAQKAEERGEVEAAIAKYQQAIGLDPGVAKWWVNLAKLQIASGDTNVAIESYQQALGLNPDIATWHAALAKLQAVNKEDQSAIESYQRAIDLKPDIASWHANLAGLYIEFDDLPSAVKCLRMAISKNEKIALWHAELKEIEQALIQGKSAEQFRKASKVEKGSGWYDAIYSNSAKYRETYEKSIYFPVWKDILNFINEVCRNEVLDVGCGPGQLACAIRDNCPGVKYRGVDISLKAIEMAKEVCPEFLFEHTDGLDAMRTWKYKDAPIVICTEVLEHIENDLGFIGAVPKGALLVASVPNFDAKGHVRFFGSSDEVELRYGDFFENLILKEISIGASSKIYLFKGVVV